MIEHVAISGGGPNGMVQIGVIAEMVRSGHLNAANLKSAYGTSAGAILCTILALNIPMEEFLEYMVHRPWNKWLDIKVMECNAQGGMMSSSKLREVIRPMLEAFDYPEDTTMLDAYEKTKVDLHIFTTEMETFQMVDLNHKTFPNLKLVDACSMSSALFPIFTPFKHEGKHYMDGAFRNNFPLNMLLKDHPADDTVFALNIMGAETDYTDPMTMMDIGFFLLNKTSSVLGAIAQTHEMGYQCKFYLRHRSKNMLVAKLWENVFMRQECRIEMVDEGRLVGQEFIRAKWAS